MCMLLKFYPMIIHFIIVWFGFFLHTSYVSILKYVSELFSYSYVLKKLIFCYRIFLLEFESNKNTLQRQLLSVVIFHLLFIR